MNEMKTSFFIIISFLLIITTSIFAQQQVDNSNRGIAYARSGDFIIRSNGSRYILNQGDIDHARKQLGLSNSPNRSKSLLNNSESSNNIAPVSSGNSYPYHIIIVIIISIIILFIIRKIIEHNEEIQYGQQRERQQQQLSKQQKQYEFEIQQQKIAEEKIIEDNIKWLKSIKSGNYVYDNTKFYITEKEWKSFIDEFKFLKVTLLDKIILPDEKTMKPYIKCSIYGSNDYYTAIFHFKETGLENEAKIFYCQNRLDDQDIIIVKSFFESTKPKRDVPLKLRDKIFSRDNYKCVFCGRGQRDGVKLHIDHIVPVSKGGSSEADNLQTLCEECNLGKSNRHSRSNHENNNIPPNNMIAFYRNLLGLRLQFTHDELKTAFRESVVKYHPDTYGSSSSRDRENAETLMKQINEAYEILKKIAK